LTLTLAEQLGKPEEEVPMSQRVVTVSEAELHLSQLIEAAIEGEEIVITRSGEPLVRLVACAEGLPRRRLGLLEGRVSISPDFDAPLPPEVIKVFEGE